MKAALHLPPVAVMGIRYGGQRTYGLVSGYKRPWMSLLAAWIGITAGSAAGVWRHLQHRRVQ
ncbi:MAG: hypothetical protein CSA09_03345 [Candidatus Contendobacter odensis]|uniref:Uncharacterized protein n=1 Tax=Candidatus Contendibacter odensensis TaxID=1400860 RepID=A0A2G6PEY2_9GAMM|nr:MAG: hypothetical protein CSA09_03345 [Candidatus Contendobacter odensis]